ncbi:type IV pilus assembly PilZ [Candidatus Koribacter versatilis Ellin345]|uniref:Type IV pilus assembly PilZ n=2 Tax=Candidatus Korobacter versatilis TaxID=658062 RepID=Q1IL03_KORVE|nr:type IV pilus assembly PilZ [Candidatus Koribacter versatilis Ellin345]
MNMDDRRKFERIALPDSTKVFAHDKQGERLGRVRVIGRGGLLIETRQAFDPGSHHELVLVDDTEGIKRPVPAVARYITPQGIGFEFETLEPDAAVEIGVIIGKYYSATAGH